MATKIMSSRRVFFLSYFFRLSFFLDVVLFFSLFLYLFLYLFLSLCLFYVVWGGHLLYLVPNSHYDGNVNS